MTAQTAPARHEQDPGLRPVPWRKMAWVTWRQHRIAVGGAAALLGALAVYLWLAGLQVHYAYDVVAACHPARSNACLDITDNFNNSYHTTSSVVAALLQVVPALIGAFVGAPVLARELESGTFRYAWTQGFSRWRWALAKLVPLAIAVAAAAGVLSLLLSWFYRPFFADGSQTQLAPTVFDLRGVAFAAWTLAAFAIGALAGMLIRRVVPAIAATLTAYTGLAFAAGLYLRQHYLTPLVTSNPNVPGSFLGTSPNVPDSAWILGEQWQTRAGRPVSEFTIAQVLQHDPQFGGGGKAGTGIPQSYLVTQYLAQHGYTLWTTYQPASRFWPLQWIEGGWLLALAVLLIAATVWLVRRRPT
jgi:ABC-type transport system involved in multi-copper enzyme maturation permease subunit